MPRVMIRRRKFLTLRPTRPGGCDQARDSGSDPGWVVGVAATGDGGKGRSLLMGRLGNWDCGERIGAFGIISAGCIAITSRRGCSNCGGGAQGWTVSAPGIPRRAPAVVAIGWYVNLNHAEECVLAATIRSARASLGPQTGIT